MPKKASSHSVLRIKVWLRSCTHDRCTQGAELSNMNMTVHAHSLQTVTGVMVGAGSAMNHRSTDHVSRFR